jgi:hypothetical protein
VPNHVAARAVRERIELCETDNALILERYPEAHVGPRAQPDQDEVPEAACLTEKVHRFLRLEHRALVERQRVPTGFTVANAGIVEAQTGETPRRELSRDLHVQPARACTVQNAGVQQQHGRQVAGLLLRTGLRQDAHQICRLAELDGTLAHHAASCP